ncbi:glycosyltransferase [Algibacter sp.]|nr:glycosyltransferase [Algibacter sp.]
MRFLIISHAEHKVSNGRTYSYAPYVREMNLWLKSVDSATIIAPKNEDSINAIDIPYEHTSLKLQKIPGIQFTSLLSSFSSILKTPYILFVLFKECFKADHIHLRCPGNIGLLGCIVQIFFPKTIKTAKYAGNWDPKAKQPLSYKLQKWILSNTFLTRNMQVLVYGDWEKQSKNIKSFFTATYHNSEIEQFVKRDYSGILNFVFTGSLVQGKRPFFAIQIMEAMHKQGMEVRLDLFGEGILKGELLDYIQANQLDSIVKIHGNQSKEVIKSALKKAHFSILPSKSEGWPKAIAEGMFFGVIPIATEISCIPFMLDYGNRGILIKADLNHDLRIIMNVFEDISELETMSKNAMMWSQLYTLDRFESDIVKILK